MDQPNRNAGLETNPAPPLTPATVRQLERAANDNSPARPAATDLYPITPFANGMRVPRMKGKLSNSVTKSVMSYARLYALIRQGFGQGRNDAYKPWIRVTKGNSSPHSNLHVSHVATQKRSLHLLAGTEFRYAELAAWLGSLETREQFPLWPHSAPHPLAGLHPERDRTLANTRGLLAIADDAGIDHGNFVGTDIPYVATTDLVLRIGEPPHDRLVFWSVKPLEKMLQGSASQRVLERLELERRYANSVCATHRVINGTEMNESLIENLDWLMPLHSEFADLLTPENLQTFAAAFAVPAKQRKPLQDCIAHARCELKMSEKAGFALFRGTAWSGLTDIDLSKPILMTRPPTQGGAAQKESMRQKLLGETK